MKHIIKTIFKKWCAVFSAGMELGLAFLVLYVLTTGAGTLARRFINDNYITNTNKTQRYRFNYAENQCPPVKNQSDDDEVM